MKPDPLADAQTERAHLKRQCMLGYALFHPEAPWNGVVYQRLYRAREALPSANAGAEIVLVHTTGALFYQSSGDCIGRVITAGGKTHHLPVQRTQRGARQALRRRAQRQDADRARLAARAKRAPGRGYQHQAFVD